MFSKFLNIFLLSSSILSVVMLSGIITILLMNKIPFDSSLVVRLMLFFILSLLYSALFILIGMGCSVVTRLSTISLLVSVSIWLFLVVILPESIGIIVKRTQNKPSDYELTEMYRVKFQSRFKKRNDITKLIESQRNYSEPEKQEKIEQIRSTLFEANNKYALECQQLDDYILQLHIRRYQLQQRWKKLSPAVLFREITERIMYSGNYYFLDFLEQVRRFAVSFRDNMYKKYGTFVVRHNANKC